VLAGVDQWGVAFIARIKRSREVKQV